MRIYKMTATFGKLDQAELVLEPGLNVIHAPNEWGKSTWCAFLTAMLYGLDTRAKSTKTTLADKERYAPWSGKPMAGRIDLNWQGRDITIERSTRGRVPLGVFRAYETASGLDVPELTAVNCGSVLLGVEQSVFRRAGFIRHADLPVTQDEALRRRLNDLVTTGDESGEADRLARRLRELKNRCRYNRTGLLPQAEAELTELEAKISERNTLKNQSDLLKTRLAEGKRRLRDLENHLEALDYEAARAGAARIAKARQLQERAEEVLLAAEADCEGLPSLEEAEKKVRVLTSFRDDWNEAHIEQTLMPEKPEEPELPEPFRNLTLQQARKQLEEDTQRFEQLSRKKPWRIFWFLALLAVLAAAAAVWFRLYWAAGGLGLLALVLLIPGLGKKKALRAETKALTEKYGSDNTQRWQEPLRIYTEKTERYEQKLLEYGAARGDMDIRMTFLRRQRQSLCPDQTPEQALEAWQRILSRRQRACQARQELERAGKYLEDLRALAQPVQPPRYPDSLTCSREETRRRIPEEQRQQRQLLERLGQYQGRIDALGEASALERERERLCQRIRKLEQTYAALELALTTLETARQELQRRFAPRIARQAGQLLQAMTNGRYDRVTLDQDLSLLTAAKDETVLHEALWRSDGTVDQLYLALRLAVAEELTPQAPLVLDDAFVRFDDDRLKAALTVLKEQAESRQILLFTCQSREKELLDL